jgi:nucleoside-diphosphate-sugar epimerase
MHSGATVLRPPWVWGAGDSNNLAALLRAHERKQLFAIDGGHHQIETVHVCNLVYAAQLAAREDAARGQVYFVTDDEPIGHQAFTGALLQAAGMVPEPRSMPHWLARLLCVWDGWRGYRLGMTPEAVSYMSQTKTFSDAKIRQQLGYRGQVTRAAGLRDLAAWVAYVGGADVVRRGRRRGEHRVLIDKTLEYLGDAGSVAGERRVNCAA